MEKDRQSDISEQADLIKDALKNGKLHKVEDLPREAFIEATIHGIVVFGLDKIYGADSVQLSQSKKEMEQRIELLDEHESKQAITQANEWLSEHHGRN